MGMDVYGKNDDSYFRNNVWWWRPLAEYVCEVAPEICAKNKYWQSNDGGGLDEADSLALAEVLTAKLDNGEVATYEKKYREFQASQPLEKCMLCDGTGIRPKDEFWDPESDWAKQLNGCNGCEGKGQRQPYLNSYPFSEENVREFRDFLLTCGGFEIW